MLYLDFWNSQKFSVELSLVFVNIITSDTGKSKL